MLNLRKKVIKDLQNNSYSIFYYLYNQNRFFLKLSYIKSSLFFINYLLLAKNFIYCFKFFKFKTSKNVYVLNLKKILIYGLYKIFFFFKRKNFLYKQYRSILLYNLKKILNFQKKSNFFNLFSKQYLFSKRWVTLE